MKLTNHQQEKMEEESRNKFFKRSNNSLPEWATMKLVRDNRVQRGKLGRS